MGSGYGGGEVTRLEVITQRATENIIGGVDVKRGSDLTFVHPVICSAVKLAYVEGLHEAGNRAGKRKEDLKIAEQDSRESGDFRTANLRWFAQQQTRKAALEEAAAMIRRVQNILSEARDRNETNGNIRVAGVFRSELSLLGGMLTELQGMSNGLRTERESV